MPSRNMTPDLWYLVLDHLDRPLLRCLAVSSLLHQIAIRKLSARLYLTEGERIRLELSNGDRVIHTVDADEHNLDSISRKLRWVRKINVKMAAKTNPDNLVSIVDTLFKSADLNALQSSITKEKVIQDALNVYRLCVDTDCSRGYQQSQLELNFVPPVVDNERVYHFPGIHGGEVITVDTDYDLNLKIFDVPFTCYSKTTVAPHITNLQWQVEEVDSWFELQEWLSSCTRLTSLEVIFNLEEEEESKSWHRLVMPPSLRNLAISGDANLTIVAENCRELDCPATDFGCIQFECPRIVDLNIMLDEEVSEQVLEQLDTQVRNLEPRNLNISSSSISDLMCLLDTIARIHGRVTLESDLSYAYRSYNSIERRVNSDSESTDGEIAEVDSDEELEAERSNDDCVVGLQQLGGLRLNCEQFSLYLLTGSDESLGNNVREMLQEIVARSDTLKGVESDHFAGCEEIGHWDGMRCYIPRSHFYKL